MKKKITVGTTCIVVLLAVLLTFQLTYSFVGIEYQAKVDSLTKTQSDFSLLAQADGLIRENFYGNFDDERVESGLISGYLSALTDPYSRYLSAEEYARTQRERSPSGNGIGVRLTWDATEKKIYICDIVENSPAAEEGLAIGDEILEINGVSAKELGFYGVLASLSGEEGTEVKLKVQRKVSTQMIETSYTPKIAKINANFVSWEWLDNSTAYLRIYSFEKGCEKEFKSVLEAIKTSGGTGVVIDVRNTSEGEASVALKMLDQLLPEGVMVRTTDGKGNIKEIKSDKNGIVLNIALLINENSSFAAEIFASVLKDFDAATLVGKTTYGKSIGQKVLELDDGSALILSNITYTPPISPSFEKIGVKPDIECDLTVENFYAVDKKEDSQIAKAFSALQG